MFMCKRKYWIFKSIHECPICGYTRTYHERRYGKNQKIGTNAMKSFLSHITASISPPKDGSHLKGASLMEKCIHDVYMPERDEPSFVSSVCTICQSLYPDLEGHYGIVDAKVALPASVSDLFDLWKATNSVLAYEKIYFIVMRMAKSQANERFTGQDDIPDWHDAAHDAGVDCLMKIESYNGNGGGFSTWAHRVIDNALTNWIERDVDKDLVSINDNDNPIDVEDTRSSVSERIFVKEVRSLLSSEELKLFEMRAEGLSDKEIADNFNVAERTVGFRRWPKLKEKIRLMGVVESEK